MTDRPFLRQATHAIQCTSVSTISRRTVSTSEWHLPKSRKHPHLHPPRRSARLPPSSRMKSTSKHTPRGKRIMEDQIGTEKLYLFREGEKVDISWVFWWERASNNKDSSCTLVPLPEFLDLQELEFYPFFHWIICRKIPGYGVDVEGEPGFQDIAIVWFYEWDMAYLAPIKTWNSTWLLKGQILVRNKIVFHLKLLHSCLRTQDSPKEKSPSDSKSKKIIIQCRDAG